MIASAGAVPVGDGARTVKFQRSDLSVSFNADLGEGSVLVRAAGETHEVGLISTVDGSPQFYLDNRVVTSAGESIKLKLEGGSLTRAVLEDTLSAYKAVYGRAPSELSGSLAQSNLSNFKNEFSRLRQQNFVNTNQAVADMAIRNISFGKSRIQLGYGNLTTQIGDFSSIGIPGSVWVRGLPGL
ncbi:hypothetical protein HNQ59_004018 [Chitinivorax tropicus]|uniref:Uncharacterized protein n=2 Tax=Chitinivorax tropicus TaxID=714531 RepID=A0A840MWE4_9PROT|nr:hypothetical protein [Chitinivorax tropicus]